MLSNDHDNDAPLLIPAIGESANVTIDPGRPTSDARTFAATGHA